MDKLFVKFVASGTLLLFGIVSILLLTVPIYELREPPQYMYGIVLDAGSSHTALYTYRWPADKLNGTGVVAQHSECHVKGGGISAYAGQRGAAGHSLEACLKQAMRDIPPDRHHRTPVYLGATAGMRLLKITHPDRASQVLQEVKQKIKSFPFSFRGAVILSGQEEGVYGWVTVNYLLENFIKAFSAYFFTHSYLQQSTGIKISTSAQLEEATQAVCNMTIEEMTRKSPHLKKYLKDYCAVAVYIQVLMLRGYSFDEHSFQNVAFQKKAGEASVGWALGYILSVSSLLPEEPAGIRKGLCPAAWICLLILLTILLTATVCYMALLVIWRKRRNGGVS